MTKSKIIRSIAIGGIVFFGAIFLLDIVSNWIVR